MMKRLFALLLAALLMAPAAMAESIPYYIDGGNADRVHLRKGPSTGEESLGLYYTGTDVILIGYEADWAWVMVGYEVGYIMREYLTLEYTSRCGPSMIVDNPDSTWVNLRTAPSMQGMVAMRPDNGTAVRVLGETADGWSYVDCEGVKGYILTSMLSAAASATVSQQTIMLSEMGWNSCIFQYLAPNGKLIYFTSELLEPRISLEDVNFDGWDDLVIMTMTSAKSTAYQFFVYDVSEDAYVYVHHTDYEGGLINYTAYPQYGIIETHATNGHAGLLHVTNLYRWEGTNLKLIRSAVSDEWTEGVFEGQNYTSIIHGDTLHIVVRDHTKSYDESVIWEIIIAEEDAVYRDVLTEEMNALWQGIK